MFLNGEGMRGGSVHHNMKGAPMLGPARTAPKYRFYSIRDEFPGLQAVAADGHSIEGELYEVDELILRDSLLPGEPAELELGIIELDDGSASFSMLLRPGLERADGVMDISSFGGWRAYRERRTT
jgi:hypothetical protein